MPQDNKRYLRKELVGTVISDKMNKTIVVRVRRIATHEVFKKKVRRFSKFKAHDEKRAAKTGDVVRIAETRPLSRGKCWRLAEVIEKAK